MLILFDGSFTSIFFRKSMVLGCAVGNDLVEKSGSLCRIKLCILSLLSPLNGGAPESNMYAITPCREKGTEGRCRNEGKVNQLVGAFE